MVVIHGEEDISDHYPLGLPSAESRVISDIKGSKKQNKIKWKKKNQIAMRNNLWFTPHSINARQDSETRRRIL